MAKIKAYADIVDEWNNYFGEDTMHNWRRLMADLGIDGYFTSKTQCRKVRASHAASHVCPFLSSDKLLITQALKNVWINICDFLDAIKNHQPVRRFGSRAALAEYTRRTHRFYPRKRIAKGSPLAALMKRIV